MSDSISCPYRSLSGLTPVCQIVADLIDRPLAECQVNDSACAYCLQCGIAPQAPNQVTASMAVGVAKRTGDPQYLKSTLDRFRPYLSKLPSAPRVTTCVLRGPEVRQVACKPCQADSLIPVMMPVYRCPRHSECTLHNSGTFPKIQACATCGDRLEKFVPLEAKPAPPAVLAAIHERQRTAQNHANNQAR